MHGLGTHALSCYLESTFLTPKELDAGSAITRLFFMGFDPSVPFRMEQEELVSDSMERERVYLQLYCIHMLR